MLTIELNGLEFFAYHGLYAEEKILGNTFMVEARIRYRPAQTVLRHLEETVDYTQVYALIRERMQQPTPLLETVVSELAVALLQRFPLAEEVEIALHKQHPPVPQFRGSVGVRYSLTRKEMEL
jgi:dihydroneopterin aldolase